MTCIVCGDAIPKTFYTSVSANGNVDIYCFDCYSRAVLDNHPGMRDGGGTKVGEYRCECGSKAKPSQNHANWCDFFRKEF